MGTDRAQPARMAGARHFTELIVWQLGDEHRVEVFALTKRPRLRADFKLRSQIDDAADSVCRNVAEESAARLIENSPGLSPSGDGR